MTQVRRRTRELAGVRLFGERGFHLFTIVLDLNLHLSILPDCRFPLTNDWDRTCCDDDVQLKFEVKLKFVTTLKISVLSPKSPDEM